MAVLTLTGHLGSMGMIARESARRLGYGVMDRELAVESVRALGWSDGEVEAFDERTGGQGGRLTRLLRAFVECSGAGASEALIAGAGLEAMVLRTYGEAATPEMRPDDERYIEQLRGLILGLAEQDNLVLVGRGGQAILADRPGTVHVRVACDPEQRIQRIVERDAMTAAAARSRIEESDRQREAWHQKYFGIDYRAPYHYHLVVNSGRMSEPQAVEVIVGAVELLAG